MTSALQLPAVRAPVPAPAQVDFCGGAWHLRHSVLVEAQRDDRSLNADLIDDHAGYGRIAGRRCGVGGGGGRERPGGEVRVDGDASHVGLHRLGAAGSQKAGETYA